jgi:UDP-3-O-[3-hydroxymyristoyl] glucosamine N-acyltransferase
MPESPFYSPAELAGIGCTAVGRHVQVSRLARFYEFRGGVGDHTRIDDFAIVKGRVEIGCYVHISAFSMMGGTAGTISFGDFSTTAAYVALYTASDDYASPLLTNSVVPADLKCGITGDIKIGRGVVLGTHCVVLPNALVHDYATIGALCIVNGEYASGGVYVTGGGRPRCVGQRDIARVKQAEAEARRRLAAEEQS